MRRGELAILVLTLALCSCVVRDPHVASVPPPAVATVPSPIPAPEPAPPVAQPAPAGAPAGADAFQAQVRPVLARTCAPCHNPGGRMYDRLPFDQPTVIREHSAGVLRRLKGADKDAVAAWLSAAHGPRE